MTLKIAIMSFVLAAPASAQFTQTSKTICFKSQAGKEGKVVLLADARDSLGATLEFQGTPVAPRGPGCRNINDDGGFRCPFGDLNQSFEVYATIAEEGSRLEIGRIAIHEIPPDGNIRDRTTTIDRCPN